jgi:hypothetical protein
MIFDNCFGVSNDPILTRSIYLLELVKVESVIVANLELPNLIKRPSARRICGGLKPTKASRLLGRSVPNDKTQRQVARNQKFVRGSSALRSLLKL